METCLRTIRALLLAALTPLLAASAFATNGTWAVDAAGNWGNSTCWTGGFIADGVSSTANLTFDITAARTVTLNTARTVGILNIGDPSASPFAYTLNNSGGAALTLDNNGSAAQINISGASANVISAPLQLTAGGLTITSSATALQPTLSTGTITSVAGNGTQTITLTHNGGNNFVISNNISDGNTGGAIAFLLDAGRLQLTGNNSYTGGTTIRSGTLMLGTTGSAALAGDINMGTASTGASSVAFHPFGRTLAGNIAVNAAGSGTMTIETYGTLNGNISLGRGLAVNANGGAMVLNGNISGSGLLSLGVNGGTLATNAVTLNGTNTGTGGVKMGGSDVTFKIANANALGNGTLTIGPNNTTHDTALAIDNTTGSSLTLPNNNPQIWEGFIFKGTNDMNMGTGNVTINTAGSQSAIVTVQQNKLTVGGVISGASASLGNAGAGTLALQGANTYTGATSVGGILAVTSLANGGSASNIGQSTNAAANLILNRGTLQYAGGAVTTDRLFTIGNGNATIDSSGSGAMVFNNAGANVSTDTVSLNFSTNAFSTNATTIIVAPTTNGTNTTRDLAVGQTISGVGIAGGTTITGILNEYQITISAATTANATASAYTFSSLNRTLTLTGNNTGANTISGILANSASTTLGVTKSGNGTWALGGTNTYTGATTISAGTLIATNASSFGGATGGAVTVAGGAAMNYAAAADAQLVLHSTLGITGGSTTTIGGAIGASATSAEINVTGAINGTAGSGTAKVNIYGINGVTPLAGTNTYTLLHSGVASTLSTALTATPALGLVYNNTNFTVGALAATSTDLTASITSATALTSAFWTGTATSGISKVWAVSDGNATSNWASTSGGAVQGLIPNAVDVTLVGTTVNATNSTLGANMAVKTLTIADTASGLSLNADGNTLTITPAASTAGITVNASVPASTIAANVALGASQTWTNNSSNLFTVSGAVSNGASALTIGGPGNTTVSGVIGGGNGTLTKAAASTLTLSGANTYTGNTTVSAGVLNIQNATALGTTAGSTSVTGGAALQIQNSITVGAEALALNGSGISNDGALRNISGSNTCGGNITLGSATRINSDSGTLTLNGTATITGATFALTVGGAGNTTITSAIGTTTGSLTKDGSGTLSLSGNNTYSGGTTVNAGKLVLSDLYRSGQTGNVTLNAGTTLGIYDGSGLGAAPSGVIFAGNSTLQFQKTTSGPIGVARTMAIGSGVTATIDTQGFNDVFDAPFTGSGGALTKIGSGSLTLNGTNTYNGLTSVTGGNLTITSPGRLASGNALTVGASGTADFQNAGQTLGAVTNANTAVNALNFSAATGTVTLASLAGSGNTRFGANGTVTGGISTGTVTSVGALTADISGGTISSGGLLTGNITSGTVGAGSLIATSVSGGTNTITGAAGITTMSNGTTTVGGVATIGTMSAGTANLNGDTSTIATLNGGSITLGNSTTLTVSSGATSGAISGGGNLTKAGNGTLVLSGSSTYTGPTNVTAGTLLANSTGGSATGSGIVTVASGATLGGNGTIGGSTTIQAGGTLSPGNSPGVETFTSGLTLETGSTFVWQLTSNSTGGRGTGFDGVDVTGGTLTVGSGVRFDAVFNLAGSTVNFNDAFWKTNQTWLVFDNATAPATQPGIFILGTVSSDSFGSSLSGNLSFSQTDNDIYLDFSFMPPVPEPATWVAMAALILTGGIMALRRRTRQGTERTGDSAAPRGSTVPPPASEAGGPAIPPPMNTTAPFDRASISRRGRKICEKYFLICHKTRATFTTL